MTREEAITILDKLWETQDFIHENTEYEQGYEEMQALAMAIEALSEPKVAYACDGRRCGADCSDCGRTTDIEHAKNFTKVCDSYFEKLQTEPYEQALTMAIEALQAEPIERISDNTIVVKYADYEDIGRIILTNGDIFCKMFYEDNTQEDDDNYDNLIPDEYKTDGDLISRADAIEAVYELLWNEPPYCDSGALCRERAKEIVNALPSADRPTPNYITESQNDVDEKNDEVIERPIIEHDREWIIGCIKHDGFIKTDRFDKANQIILDALADRPTRGRKDATEEDYHYCDDCEAVEMCMWYPYYGCQFKVSRPRGEWQQVEIIDDDEPSGINTDASQCSVCGVIQQSHYWATHYYSYCPSCGARMENTK